MQSILPSRISGYYSFFTIILIIILLGVSKCIPEEEKNVLCEINNMSFSPNLWQANEFDPCNTNEPCREEFGIICDICDDNEQHITKLFYFYFYLIKHCRVLNNMELKEMTVDISPLSKLAQL